MGLRKKTTQANGLNRSHKNFSSVLSATAHAIIGDARRAITNPKLSSANAVHDIRKALKRWRALMRLLEEPMGAPAVRMRRRARNLMRALAHARDFQSALDAAKDLRKGNKPLPKTSLLAVSRRLTKLRDREEAKSFSRTMRERLQNYLDFAAITLDRWPLDSIDFGTLTDGMTNTYHRARRLIPEKWGKIDPAHLHSLRQRVVEHRHHMDLIESLWAHSGKARMKKTQRLRHLLGACQDLAVLADFTQPRKPLAAWRPQIKPLIAAHRSSHLKAVARLSNKLFADKPKTFRKEIAMLGVARPKEH